MTDANRWHVHITFTDGTEEIASGDPTVTNDCLIVRAVADEYPNNILFEAGYPLRHVKWWWVDYEHEAIVDGARWTPDVGETR